MVRTAAHYEGRSMDYSDYAIKSRARQEEQTAESRYLEQVSAELENARLSFERTVQSARSPRDSSPRPPMMYRMPPDYEPPLQRVWSVEDANVLRDLIDAKWPFREIQMEAFFVWGLDELWDFAVSEKVVRPWSPEELGRLRQLGREGKTFGEMDEEFPEHPQRAPRLTMEQLRVKVPERPQRAEHAGCDYFVLDSPDRSPRRAQETSMEQLAVEMPHDLQFGEGRIFEALAAGFLDASPTEQERPPEQVPVEVAHDPQTSERRSTSPVSISPKREDESNDRLSLLPDHDIQLEGPRIVIDSPIESVSHTPKNRFQSVLRSSKPKNGECQSPERSSDSPDYSARSDASEWEDEGLLGPVGSASRAAAEAAFIPRTGIAQGVSRPSPTLKREALCQTQLLEIPENAVQPDWPQTGAVIPSSSFSPSASDTRRCKIRLRCRPLSATPEWTPADAKLLKKLRQEGKHLTDIHHGGFFNNRSRDSLAEMQDPICIREGTLWTLSDSETFHRLRSEGRTVKSIQAKEYPYVTYQWLIDNSHPSHKRKLWTPESQPSRSVSRADSDASFGDADVEDAEPKKLKRWTKAETKKLEQLRNEGM